MGDLDFSKINNDYGALINAAIVLVSITIILYQVHVSRKTARRRASFDFIASLQTNDTYQNARKEWLKILDGEKGPKSKNGADGAIDRLQLSDFSKWPSEFRRPLFQIINEYETMAGGVFEGLFDERFLYRLMKSRVIEDWKKMQAAVTADRQANDHDTLFCEAEKLATRWDAIKRSSDNPPTSVAWLIYYVKDRWVKYKMIGALILAAFFIGLIF